MRMATKIDPDSTDYSRRAVESRIPMVGSIGSTIRTRQSEGPQRRWHTRPRRRPELGAENILNMQQHAAWLQFWIGGYVGRTTSLPT